ncbi:hypothetical protein LCGC14_1283460 [marine sediment metagenome]|uniref:Rad50/SbcC-type AAA domain-containing protein n=1 Tax=marine sediment metagenome TaxID=412755 RepID=A0A0F9KW96_9ZZZZ
MKVTRLTIQNLMKITAAQITPEGNVVVISGPNGAGKSTVLNSIAMALGGARLCPDRPIKDGKSSATVMVELGDFTVTRKFTQKGNTLTVTAEDGSIFKSPQAMLDKLVCGFTFNPLAFKVLPGKEQRDQLLDLVELDVDLDDLEKERAAAYSVRASNNKSAQETKGQLAGLLPRPAPLREEVSVSDIAAELREAEFRNRTRDLAMLDMERAVKAYEYALEELTALRETMETCVKAADNSPETTEIEPIDQRLSTAEATNVEIRAEIALNCEHNELQDALQEFQEGADVMEAKIKDCDQRKAEALSKATFPIPGLSFGDGGVLYNGFPLDQCAASEQLKVSMAIGMALNPELRIMMVHDASLLDRGNMEIVEQMAADKDYQFWLEVVDESKKLGVVIEDGQVYKEEA